MKLLRLITTNGTSFTNVRQLVTEGTAVAERVEFLKICEFSLKLIAILYHFGQR